MIETNTLKTIKKILDDFSNEYRQIVNIFEQSIMGTESIEEEKMSIRMKALDKVQRILIFIRRYYYLAKS